MSRRPSDPGALRLVDGLTVLAIVALMWLLMVVTP